MSPLRLLLAPAGALCFGVGLALQKRRAMALPPIGAAGGRGARAFLADPGWRAATAVLVLGWVLELAALRGAPLSVVMPCNVLSLAVLCLLASRWFGERLHAREWLGVVACALGVVAGGLSAGGEEAEALGRLSPSRLGGTVAGLLGLAAVAVAAARRRPSLGEVGLACAAGLTYASTGLLTKAVALPGPPALRAGLGAALAVLSVLAVGVMQGAFQRGRAVVVVATTNVLADFLPALLGAAVFHERWPAGADAVLRASALGLLLLGLALLAPRAARSEAGAEA